MLSGMWKHYYELLYSIVDTKESEYKNKIIADKLNTSIFHVLIKTQH